VLRWQSSWSAPCNQYKTTTTGESVTTVVTSCKHGRVHDWLATKSSRLDRGNTSHVCWFEAAWLWQHCLNPMVYPTHTNQQPPYHRRKPIRTKHHMRTFPAVERIVCHFQCGCVNKGHIHPWKRTATQVGGWERGNPPRACRTFSDMCEVDCVRACACVCVCVGGGQMVFGLSSTCRGLNLYFRTHFIKLP
jgi:hypothetical protein